MCSSFSICIFLYEINVVLFQQLVLIMPHVTIQIQQPIVTGKEVTEHEVPDFFSVVPESLVRILELIQPSTFLMRAAGLMILRNDGG